MSKVYTRDEVVEASTQYFNGDKLAAGVFANKYSLKNSKLEYTEDNPEVMHKRMAKEFARAEAKFPNPMSEEEIFKMFDHFDEVIPGGSSMFGLGNNFQKVSLSNCFVIDTVDSYGGICRTDERIVQISKRRGGVGVDISPIRPKGMPTRNSAFTTDGIVVFMDRFSNSAREVAQNGRRGALMISISVHHPEIMNFIRAKRDLEKVTGANISVRVTDEFMNAVKKDKPYEQRWPVDSATPSMSAMVGAKEVWNEMIKSVYLSAEPGILFWDTIIRNSPADSYAHLGFKTTSTNPCGELPLCEADSCRLMSINLMAMVDDPFTDKAKFNDEKYKNIIRKSMRLMDDLVELELEAVDGIIQKIKNDPEADNVKGNELNLWEQVKEKCSQGRRTGLGVTALGDCIAMLGIKYGDKNSLKMVEKIYKILRDESYRASIEMAKERGSFPIYDSKLEKDNEFIQRLPEDILKDMKKYGRRNIGCLTTAPSGSISVIAQTSSGFEPVFKAKYVRKRKISESENVEPDFVDELGDKWKEYEVLHHGLTKYKEITGKGFEGSPYDGAQANELDHSMRVKMQATATKYVCHAISSTINLPKDVDFEVVESLYMQAWEQGCKGLTAYREGSRDGVLTSSGHNTTRTCEDCDEAGKQFADLVKGGLRPSTIVLSASPTRPKVLECDIQRSRVGGGDWIFFVGKLNGEPYEIFGGDSKEFTIPHKYKKGWIVKNGKVDGVTQYNLIIGSLDDENEKLEFKGIAKHFNNYEYGAFTRLCSLTIRHGTPIKYICEQIIKKGVEGDLFSFQRAMSRVLKKYIGDDEKSETECEECGAKEMVYRAGCPTCMVCGHSKCA